MNKPALHIVPATPVEARSTIIESGPYRCVVGEHPTEVYLAIGNGRGDSAMFADPLTALAIGKAIIDAAGKALEFQFAQQLAR